MVIFLITMEKARAFAGNSAGRGAYSWGNFGTLGARASLPEMEAERYRSKHVKLNDLEML